MKVSRKARREAKELFLTCVVNGTLDETRARQAVRQVIERKPRGYLEILSQFQRLVKLDLERRTARVESAVPLPPDLQSNIQASLARRYGAGLNVGFVHNPALIGGMRIKVGSDVY